MGLHLLQELNLGRLLCSFRADSGCDVAPQTFCIQNDNGRANVYTQWGNSEDLRHF